MKDNKKTYWKGIEQLTNDPAFVKNADREFPEFPGSEGDAAASNRRDFLKMMGFGVAAVSLAACEAPIRKALPYVEKPVDVDPGVPNYYASTYMQGGDYCSIVVKTREGRPIKIQGNKLSGISKGGVNAQVEASVLTMYDNERLRTPKKGDAAVTWDMLDEEVTKQLNSVAARGGNIRIVSNTVLSPTTKKVIADFSAKFPSTEHVQYDPISAHGLLEANQQSFGMRAVPSYDFSKADVIVSFGADFLGTWISPVEYTKQYSQTRKLNNGKKTMSRHYQVESNLSLTGANADYRVMVKPSEEGTYIKALHDALNGGKSSDLPMLSQIVADLKKSMGKSLVVSASNDPNVQVLVNSINNMLASYGSTIDWSKPAYYRQGNDVAMDRFIDDLKAKRVGAVIFYNCNPVYNHPRGAEIASALAETGLSISTSDRPDETAVACQFIAPDNHFLESWNDAEPKMGEFSFVQPTITRVFDTRQAQESFLKWSGTAKPDYYAYLRQNWSATLGNQMAWDKALMDGVLSAGSSSTSMADSASVDSDTSAFTQPAFSGNVSAAASAIKSAGSGVELAMYSKVAIGDGSQANNPWLQETPDPVTKSTWDNYLTVSQEWATENKVTAFEGKSNLANVTVGGTTITVPILIQPGQAPGTVGLAVGYGRTSAGTVADNVGVNAFPLIAKNGNMYSWNVTSGVTIEVLSEKYQIAQTQTHQTYMGRETVIQETVLAAYQKNPSAGRYNPHVASWKSEEGEVSPGSLSLWKGHKYNNHHWGLAIDLNSCTGCSACHVACQSENNIPVVGRDEVIMRRDMHWMRIDRYYSSDADPGDLKGLEKAAANPEVTFQPMMCQHCNNAPCETVCPVAATTHSTEGINQMTYNRCIGTRYCANNCPYKVRRFNWFKYHDNGQFEDVNTAMNNDLGKMVLNPDVTVRSRGVMEKCSLCIQRIQYGKLEAKKEGRRPKDGDIEVACASACPSDAIVFGDMNDSESKIYQMLKIHDTEEADFIIEKEIHEPRAYHVLEEIGVKPNVTYLTKVRNKDAEAEKADA